MFNIRVHVFVCLGAIITALTGISGVSANPVERYHRISSKRNADNTSTTYSVPATHITVGYRSVHPGQAAIYNEKHTLVYDPDAPLPEGVVVGAETTIQLGPGVYLTANPGGWEGDPGEMHCHVAARKSAVDGLDKVWVPVEKWWPRIGEPLLHDYMYDEFKVDRDYALAISLIDYAYSFRTPQVLIPYNLVNPPHPEMDRGMDWKVICEADWKDLPVTDTVDFGTWPKVHGEVQEEWKSSW